MPKLYVSCIVLALLALAVMPAIAGELADGYTGPVASGDWAEVTVSAEVPEYINLDDVDLDIIFGTLDSASNVGYVWSADKEPAAPGTVIATEDTAWYRLSANVPVWVTYDNGSDLALDGAVDGYELELQFSSKTSGMIDWDGGTNYAAGGDTYSIWVGCGNGGSGRANATAATPPGLSRDTGTFGFAACQTLTFTIRARLYQAGLLVDPGGDYSQMAGQLLTLTFYDNEALEP